MYKRQRYIISTLNPYARPWIHTNERGAKEERTIYITFSDGYPLSESQLLNFFNRYIHRCIFLFLYVYSFKIGIKVLFYMRFFNYQVYCVSNRVFGLCVESVYIHYYEPYLEKPPLFGKIVFYRRSTVWLVLQFQEEARYIINRRCLWCKKYIS